MSSENETANNNNEKRSWSAWLGEEWASAKKAVGIIVGHSPREQVATGVMTASGWALIDGILDQDWFQVIIGGIGCAGGATLRWWPGLVGLQDKAQLIEPPKIQLDQLTEEQLAELAGQLGISTQDAVSARNLVLLPDDELAKAIEDKYGPLLRAAATGGHVSSADRKVLQAIKIFGEAARRQAAATK